MPNPDAKKLHPHVPFLYEMAVSFFDMAKENLDPVLQATDGYKGMEVDTQGRPKSPDHVADRIRTLPADRLIAYVGACLSATTNLGLAYVHTFRLLGFLTRGQDPLPVKITTPHLVKLFDALPDVTRQAVFDIDDKVKAHDLEIEITSGQFSGESGDANPQNGQGLRATLAYWQSRRLLQDSHRSLFGADGQSVLRLYIPFRSILILDKIIAEQIAPQFNIAYETVDQRMTRHAKGPVLKWENETIYVSLPKRMGRTLEARWKPGITSVVRIREAGEEMWSPGFETPFNACTFVDLKPETRYDIHVSHKNDAGEGEPVIKSMTTAAG